jgi:hypothetical protein
MFRRLKTRHGALLCMLVLLTSPGGAVERLDYRVIYRGVFSMGNDLPIAAIRLETRRLEGARLSEMRLDVSSSDYPLAESLYPIRYRFRSWTDAASGETLGFAIAEPARDGRHRLFLRDGSMSGTRRFDLRAGSGREYLDQLEAGLQPEGVLADRPLYDRLALLQRIRAGDLRAGGEYRFPVTNGRERFLYRVRVEGARRLMLAGTRVPTWKLRVDGAELTPGGGRRAAHRPLYVWVSQAEPRTPLRVDARHAIGTFRIELEGRPDEVLAADRAPDAELNPRPASDG